MHHEYRRYQVLPGAMDRLLQRFEQTTLTVWNDVGIQARGFWQTDVGRSSNFHYLLEWEDLGERAERLQAFRTDPRWLEARHVTEQAGPLIAHVDTELWLPLTLQPAATSESQL